MSLLKETVKLGVINKLYLTQSLLWQYLAAMRGCENRLVLAGHVCFLGDSQMVDQHNAFLKHPSGAVQQKVPSHQ